jgi:enamine deaminase RidA (YjgF/YER057c/UK114 family)
MSNGHPKYANVPGISAPPGRISTLAITRSSELVFLAGQIPDVPSGADVPFEEQVTQVYGKIRTILDSVGLSMRNIVQMTTFLVGPENVNQFKRIRDAIFDEIFEENQYPPNTAVVVQSLGREGHTVSVEVQVIASREVG